MKRFVLLGVDLLLILGATVLALLLRDNFEFDVGHFEALFPYLLIIVGCSAIVLSIVGANKAIWRFTTTNDYKKIVIACGVIVLASLALMFSLNRLDGISRSLPVLQLMLMPVMLISARVLIRSRNRQRIKPAQFKSVSPSNSRTSVLVIGATTLAELYIRTLMEFAQGKIHVVGVMARRDTKLGRTIVGYKVEGKSDAVLERINELLVHGIQVDRVVVMTTHRNLSESEKSSLADVEAKTDISVQYIDELALGSFLDRRVRQDDVACSEESRPKFVLSNEHLDELRRKPYWKLKRTLDAVFAGLLIVITAPISVLVAILVALDVGAPIVFWQQRPGVSGSPFRVFKFRTMRAARGVDGNWIPDEQRLSKIGKFLRQTHLDELPQLWNILAGQMSFVGPRPLLPKDQPEEYSVRKFVRPGLTGWAQVNGGRSVSAADKAALDIWYIENASFALDFRIFVRTLNMVLIGERSSAAMIGRAWHDLGTLGICQHQALDADVNVPATDVTSTALAQRVA